MASKTDRIKISNVVLRVHDECPEINVLLAGTCLEIAFDNGYIDINRMHNAPAHQLKHDIVGLERHLDTETGELLNCFWPRFAPRGE
jgi:hypothetical protein